MALNSIQVLCAKEILVFSALVMALEHFRLKMFIYREKSQEEPTSKSVKKKHNCLDENEATNIYIYISLYKMINESMRMYAKIIIIVMMFLVTCIS